MEAQKLKHLKSILANFKTIKKITNPNSSKHFLNFKSYNFLLGNNKIITREQLIKGKLDGSAIIVIPMLSNNEFLCVIEPRVFTKLTVGIGFPAGYIEKNESEETAALRELQEETGYTTSKLIKLDEFYQDEGCSAALNTIYLALNCQKISEQHLDKDEYIEYVSFTLQELLELESLGYIKGGNTKLALAKLKEYIANKEKIIKERKLK